VIFLNEDDIEEMGLASGEKVDITSHWQDGTRQVTGFTVVPYAIPKGCAAAYFPEANPLVPLESYARRSFTPTSKCILISLRPSNGGRGE
jgi:formate dehydrogenase major subunit